MPATLPGAGCFRNPHFLHRVRAQLLDRFAFYMMPGSHILGDTVTRPNAETETGARRHNWVWYRRVSEGEVGKVLTDAEGRVHPHSLAPGQLLPYSRRQALVEDAARLLPPPFAAAVAAERQPFVQAIFDYEAPRMAHGRLALLGDAAFVVRPHTAMGVAKAREMPWRYGLASPGRPMRRLCKLITANAYRSVQRLPPMVDGS